MVASTFTHDRGVAGSRQDLLHVLPVAGSDKMWYLNATRAGLLHGVWEPPQRDQPQHDRARRLAHTSSRRQLFHPSWWPRGQGDCYAVTQQEASHVGDPGGAPVEKLFAPPPPPSISV